jgi:hypothetical protein
LTAAFHKTNIDSILLAKIKKKRQKISAKLCQMDRFFSKLTENTADIDSFARNIEPVFGGSVYFIVVDDWKQQRFLECGIHANGKKR